MYFCFFLSSWNFIPLCSSFVPGNTKCERITFCSSVYYSKSRYEMVFSVDFQNMLMFTDFAPFCSSKNRLLQQTDSMHQHRFMDVKLNQICLHRNSTIFLFNNFFWPSHPIENRFLIISLQNQSLFFPSPWQSLVDMCTRRIPATAARKLGEKNSIEIK